MTGLIVAIDGGNSKTDVVMAATDGRLLGAVRGPTTSHQAVGLEVGLDRLAGLVLAARARSGLDPGGPPADTLVCCLAGLDLPIDERRLGRAYASRGFARVTELHNDTLAALRAGTPDGWGVAVICGAGVNAVGRHPDGRTARFAGLGTISGDRGGGSGLGMAGLGAAVRARDGRGPATSLVRTIPAHFGLRRPEEVSEAIYLGRLQEARMCELAPVVCEAGRDGDAVAKGLVDEVADELAAFALASIRRLGMSRRPVPVVLAGGLARGAADLLVPRVSALVRAVAPAAEVSVLHAPPVLGAALLGLDRLAPGDRAAADAIRDAIVAWDRTLADGRSAPASSGPS
ncbi:MAG: BadF/BadG/BcrA/BcrD ATPase family protein [Chloroflexota bacterium]